MSLRPAAAALLLLAAGCTGPSPYTRSRISDLTEALPVSISWGWGISIDAQATPLLHLGLGLTPVVCERVGYEDRVFHGQWDEYYATFPWSFLVCDVSDLPPRPYGFGGKNPFPGSPPFVYRWQVRRDAPLGSGENQLPSGAQPQLRQWGRHPPLSRETTGALLIPQDRRELNWHDLRHDLGDPDLFHQMGSPARATLWEVSRDGPAVPRAWDLFQVDAFALWLGLRVGVRPWECLDFLVGIVGLDISGDDYHYADAPTPIPPPPGTEHAPAEPPPTDAAPASEPPAEPAPEPEPQPPEPGAPEPGAPEPGSP
jgi:hypothetical protein